PVINKGTTTGLPFYLINSFNGVPDLGAFEYGGAVSNQSPTVIAGADQTIILPALANLSGTASDDGLPSPPGTLTTTGSKVSGPGTVAFGNAKALSTTASFASSGTYVLRLTASDSVLSSTDNVTVTALPAGTVSLAISTYM